MTERFMLRRPLPIFYRQLFQTLNETHPFSHILVKCFV